MSKENNNNNTIIMQLLSPSINFASLKARLRFNELKKELSKSKYHNYFKKYHKLNAITCKMSNKYSLSDLYRYEKSNSVKIQKELKHLNSELKIFQKKLKNNQNKYKLQKSNDSKTNDNKQNRNNIIDSVKEDITKYLKELHNSNNENKMNRRLIFSNLRINIHPYLRNNLKTKSINFKSLNYLKSLNKKIETNLNSQNQNLNISKSKIKKFISIDVKTSKIKSKLSLFNNMNDNNQNFNKKNFFNFKKNFPFLRQNSVSFNLDKEGEIIKKTFINNFENNSPNSNNNSNLINLPYLSSL